MAPDPGAVAAFEPPDPPEGLGDQALEAWNAFFRSPVGTSPSLEDIDLAVVLRWVLMLDQWHEAMEECRNEPTVPGSMGQTVLNPRASEAKSLAAEIYRLEAQLGIGVKHRADLGIAVGQAKITAQDLAKMSARREGKERRELDPADPIEAEVLAEFEPDEG